ncbi:MAG TPA: penicillin-binding protein 1A [Peptococcaceae bacterium]|nr:penicillin-binding protein 1A [Peptococcaceae bacterium]
MEKTKSRRRRPSGRQILQTALVFIIVFAFIALGAVGGYTINVIRSMPDYDLNALTGELSSLIYDRNETQIGTFRAAKNRLPLEPTEIPLLMKQAIVSIEDQRFFKHNGVDPVRIGGAALANIKKGGRSQGASTITMQLARTAILESQEKKWDRKIQEAWLALKLEKQYSKEQLLAFYLNHVYYGHSAYSLQTASNAYFGKDAAQLTLGEAAALAGIINSPGRFDPYDDMEACKNRQAIVLNEMVKMKYISKEEAEAAKAETLQLSALKDSGSYAYQSFFDYVFNEAADILKIDESNTIKLYTGGYRIYTTMDLPTQTKAEEVYANTENFPKGKDDKLIQSAMVVMEAGNGEIWTLIGGRNVNEERGFNRATDALRQPGSAFKPIAVYGPAMERGYGPGTVVDDYPDGYQTQEMKFVNYNNAYRGLTTLRVAVANSINTIAVKMQEKIGVQAGIDFAKSVGITSLVESGAVSDSGVSIALGGLTHGVSPLELTAAYCTFPNQGVYNKPYAIRRIEDYKGNVLYEHSVEKSVAMSPQSAYLLTDMMVSAVQSGTAKNARMDRPVAGKTGTTSFNVDAWFVGYSADLVGSVWLGYDKSDRMYDVFGGSYGAPIWKQVMETAHRGLPVKSFPVPAGITTVSIDSKSGLLPSDLTPKEYIISEKFNANNVPTETSNVWVQAPVCSESGLLLTDGCPQPALKTFLKRLEPWVGEIAPADSKLEVPTTYCTLHGGGSGGTEDNGKYAIRLYGRSKDDDAGSKVTLSWYYNLANANTTYHIFRAQQPNTPADAATRVAVLESNGASFSESLPAATGKYYYYIQAVDKGTGQVAGVSNEISIATSSQNSSGYTTPILTGSISKHGSSYGVQLSWTEPFPGHNVVYQVFRSEDPSFSADASTLLPTSENITTNRFSDTTVSPGKVYYYRVSGLDLDGNQPIPQSTLLKASIPEK